MKRFYDFCRSKDDASAEARDISFRQPPPFRSHRAPAVVSTSGCRCRCRRSSGSRNPPEANAHDISLPREEPAYLWGGDDYWHVEASASAYASPRRRKIDSGEDVLFPPAISMLEARRRKVEHAAAGCWLSSDEEKEEDVGPGCPLPEARGLRRLVTGSVAVVKRSEDPRGDFRRSMAEMVVEKGIYSAVDLEQLLQCFLSLNSHHHHLDIIAAFADVWEALFPAAYAGGGY